MKREGTLVRNFKIKILVTLISLLLVIIVVVMYFMDKSLDWNKKKILSCFIISAWVLFIPQMIVYFWFKVKNSGLEYSTGLGFEIGMRSFLGFILAPYYGLRFYFVDLNGIKYDGAWLR